MATKYLCLNRSVVVVPQHTILIPPNAEIALSEVKIGHELLAHSVEIVQNGVPVVGAIELITELRITVHFGGPTHKCGQGGDFKGHGHAYAFLEPR